MKLLDMEQGKIYETEASEWRRTEKGIERKYKDGNLWSVILNDWEVIEVEKPHEWTPDELIRIGRATVKAFENEDAAIVTGKQIGRAHV